MTYRILVSLAILLTGLALVSCQTVRPAPPAASVSEDELRAFELVLGPMLIKLVERPNLEPYLRQKLAEPGFAHRDAALALLALRGQQQYLPQLRQLFAAGDTDRKLLAAAALYAAGDESVAPFVLTVAGEAQVLMWQTPELPEDDWYQQVGRFAACQTILNRGYQQMAQEKMPAYLRHADPQVRRGALALLRRSRGILIRGGSLEASDPNNWGYDYRASAERNTAAIAKWEAYVTASRADWRKRLAAARREALGIPDPDQAAAAQKQRDQQSRRAQLRQEYEAATTAEGKKAAALAWEQYDREVMGWADAWIAYPGRGWGPALPAEQRRLEVGGWLYRQAVYALSDAARARREPASPLPFGDDQDVLLRRKTLADAATQGFAWLDETVAMLRRSGAALPARDTNRRQPYLGRLVAVWLKHSFTVRCVHRVYYEWLRMQPYDLTWEPRGFEPLLRGELAERLRDLLAAPKLPREGDLGALAPWREMPAEAAEGLRLKTAWLQATSDETRKTAALAYEQYVERKFGVSNVWVPYPGRGPRPAPPLAERREYAGYLLFTAKWRWQQLLASEWREVQASMAEPYYDRRNNIPVASREGMEYRAEIAQRLRAQGATLPAREVELYLTLCVVADGLLAAETDEQYRWYKDQYLHHEWFGEPYAPEFQALLAARRKELLPPPPSPPPARP